MESVNLLVISHLFFSRISDLFNTIRGGSEGELIRGVIEAVTHRGEDEDPGVGNWDSSRDGAVTMNGVIAEVIGASIASGYGGSAGSVVFDSSAAIGGVVGGVNGISCIWDDIQSVVSRSFVVVIATVSLAGPLSFSSSSSSSSLSLIHI